MVIAKGEISSFVAVLPETLILGNSYIIEFLLVENTPLQMEVKSSFSPFAMATEMFLLKS